MQVNVWRSEGVAGRVFLKQGADGAVAGTHLGSVKFSNFLKRILQKEFLKKKKLLEFTTYHSAVGWTALLV